MSVYVKNHDGTALMPCTEAKARKLLQAEKAKILQYRPFTIQLCWQCEGHVADVICGIDKGSSVTGLACVGNGTVLLAAEIHHRRDVKVKMQDRRDRRKSRRSRLWYRPARFDNRASSKRSGRLPPSIKTNVEEVIRVVKRLPLPISALVIEDVQVDIARLNNPELKGSALSLCHAWRKDSLVDALWLPDGYPAQSERFLQNPHRRCAGDCYLSYRRSGQGAREQCVYHPVPPQTNAEALS